MKNMLFQRGRVWSAICLAALVAMPALAGQPIRPADSLPASTPWDLVALSVAPEFEWIDAASAVRALTYRSEPFKGKATRVFAYYASPATLRADGSVDSGLPAIVLVHGGGGTAFPDWARSWAERGYAAIAMDLAGCGADGKRLADGGPGQGDDVKFGWIDEPLTDQWTYHAVANVILAHSLVRSLPEVDAERTAVTGISWGGYLTCIVAGLDNRFKAATPVYGCGFLHENSYWKPNSLASLTPEQRKKWVRLWDPSSYIGSASMPVFFVNGTNDFAYPLDSYAKTYGLVQSPRQYRITVRMSHGHPPHGNPMEIGLFTDSILRSGVALPRIDAPCVVDGEAVAKVQSPTRLVQAQMHYTTDSGEVNKREWKSQDARIEGNRILAPAPPEGATIWMLTATDERNATVSSCLVFAGE